jgi:hypothetical protein
MQGSYWSRLCVIVSQIKRCEVSKGDTRVLNGAECSCRHHSRAKRARRHVRRSMATKDLFVLFFFSSVASLYIYNIYNLIMIVHKGS